MNAGSGRFKINVKTAGMLILFGASMVNRLALMLWLVILIVRSFRNVQNAVDGLILIAMRTVLNPQISINISAAQMVKWVAIFVISGIILLNTLFYKRTSKVKTSVTLIAILGLFITFLSIMNSSFPIVSIFKCFSYCFVFVCTILGVDYTKETVDWIAVLYKYFTGMFLASAIFSPFSFSYYSSARWFMGMTNQSQMFAIMAVLYLSILICRMISGKRSTFGLVMLCVTSIMTYMSGSRTGIIAASVCLLYAFYMEVFINKRYWVAIFAIFAVAGVFLMGFGDEIAGLIRKALLKGAAGVPTATVSIETLTSSRFKQYLAFQRKFNNDKLFGSGFMVPFFPGVRSWNLSFDLIVENGNLFYSILGDIGIVGLLVFVCCYGYIFAMGNKKHGRVILFLAPFLICMGEMVFFSTNNNAPILYVMLASYLCENDRVEPVRDMYQ